MERKLNRPNVEKLWPEDLRSLLMNEQMNSVYGFVKLQFFYLRKGIIKLEGKSHNDFFYSVLFSNLSKKIRFSSVEWRLWIEMNFENKKWSNLCYTNNWINYRKIVETAEKLYKGFKIGLHKRGRGKKIIQFL